MSGEYLQLENADTPVILNKSWLTIVHEESLNIDSWFELLHCTSITILQDHNRYFFWKVLAREFLTLWSIDISDSPLAIEIEKIRESWIHFPFPLFKSIYSWNNTHLPAIGSIDDLDSRIERKNDWLLSIQRDDGSIKRSSIDDDILSWEVKRYWLWMIWKCREWHESIDRNNSEFIECTLCMEYGIFSSCSCSDGAEVSRECSICISQESWFEWWIALESWDTLVCEYLAEVSLIMSIFSESETDDIKDIFFSWGGEYETILDWREDKSAWLMAFLSECQRLISKGEILILELPCQSHFEVDSWLLSRECQATFVLMEKIPIDECRNTDKENQDGKSENSRTHRKICNWAYYRQNQENTTFFFFSLFPISFIKICSTIFSNPWTKHDLSFPLL